MKRVYVLGLVDALALSLFACLVSTGGVLLLRLPPGSGRRVSIWGLSRHEWGDIHSVIAGLFLLVLTVHIAMHYRWIVAMVQGSDPAQRFKRTVTAFGITITILFILLLPLVASINIAGR
jgi:Domain of unknown function (DUF4405)